MFSKIDVLKNLAIFTGKLKACNFIKKRFPHKCFPLNISEFLRKTILIEHPLVAASGKVETKARSFISKTFMKPLGYKILCFVGAYLNKYKELG